LIGPVRYLRDGLDVALELSRGCGRPKVRGDGTHKGHSGHYQGAELGGGHRGDPATAVVTTASTAPQNACCEAVVKIGWPVSSNSIPFTGNEMYRPAVPIRTRDALRELVTRIVILAVVATRLS
jgi:hypothetical protein